MANPTVDEIFAATDIVGLVSEYVGLTKKGKNYVGLCPFHAEKTPSFTVSPDKKLAHCFSCGKGGSPAQFLMDLKHIEFKEALTILAQKAGLEYSTFGSPEKKQSLTKYYEITSLAKEFYKRNLLKTESGQIALEYLHKRGISDETIKMFDIGLAPAKIDSLYQVLKESNYLDIDMKATGLIKSGATGNYDMFSKRIMFPITDEHSNVVGFSARLYVEDKTQPKYINSTENIIFKKSQVLYNLDKASMHITKAGRVVLHEGFMDVFASVASGIGEAVCSMGTALTDSHAKILKRYTNNVVICYDGDKAGLLATKKAINVFKRNMMQIHVVMLPNGMDPDEYVRAYGDTAYLEYFNANLLDPIEFLYRVTIRSYNLQDNNEVDLMKNEIFDVLEETHSQSTAEIYLNKLAGVLNISIGSLLQDYTRYCNTNSREKYVEYPPKIENNYFLEEKLDSPNFSTPEINKARLFVSATKSRDYCQYIDAKISEYDLFNYLGSEFATLWYQLCDGYYNRYDIYSSEKFQSYLVDNKGVIDTKHKYSMLVFNDKTHEHIKHDDINLNELLHSIIASAYAYEIKQLNQQICSVSEGQLELVEKQRSFVVKLNKWKDEYKKFKDTQIIRK